MEIEEKQYISCSTFKKKQETVKEQNLITVLQSLENCDSIDIHTVQRMGEIKSLQKIRNKKMESIAIRLRAKWLKMEKKYVDTFAALRVATLSIDQ